MYTYLVLSVNSIAGTNASCIWTAGHTTRRSTISPVRAALSIWTIPSHVTSITADATDDTRSEVALLGTIIFTVTNLTTVLAGLVLIVTESTIQSSKLTELIALEFVLTFRNGCSLGR